MEALQMKNRASNKTLLGLLLFGALKLGVVSVFLVSCGGGSSKDHVDNEAPDIEAVQPPQGSKITDITLPLRFSVTDKNGSGVDEDSIVITANGVDRGAEASFANDELILTPTRASYWQRGPLDIKIKAMDKAGNAGEEVFSYTVSPVTMSLPRAVPENGDAPLSVALYPDASIDAVIESYEWDFDDDGVYDVSDPIGRVQIRHFNEPGSYVVRLRVVDSMGNESIGETTIEVFNAPPEIVAEAKPSNGEVPLLVNFSVQAMDNEGIASYEWDFDGDGQIDESKANSGNASYQYSTTGVFRPVLTVTDVQGASTKLQVPSIDVRVGPPGTPTISAGAYPSEGKAPLSVRFTANVSDPGGGSVSLWEWDFDGDGEFDSNSPTSGTVNHEYASSGIRYAKVRATMADGDRVEDVVRINVLQDLELSLSTDTIDLARGESATITTRLGGASTVSVIIEDMLGKTVRTLVDNESRTSGSYDDIWDGKDDQGMPVMDGQYRAILLYEESGENRRFDLGLTTGGRESNPVATYPDHFAPFAADPLVINYSLDRASEVTAFMGYLGAGTRRLFTFYHRRPQGRGSHQIIWNGENEEGVLIDPPPGSSGFLVGLFAYSLPDNGIIVKNAVEISDLAVAPPIMIPDSASSEGTVQQSVLQFVLDRDARITHTINNADTGEEIYRKIHEAVAAGAPQLIWDGRTNRGDYVAPGNYRHGITAVDEQGNKSPTLYTMQRIYY